MIGVEAPASRAAPASRVAGDLVAWAAARLRPVSDSARLDAELLLGATAGLDRVAIIAHPERVLREGQAAAFAAAVARRADGEPLAYLVGYRDFHSLRLAVDRHALVPRPETELLVELALAQPLEPGSRVLDLGTGTGAIALALGHERPDLELTAVDVSAEVLAVARGNAGSLGLELEWLESDWFAALEHRRFDLIVSNPPYVASGDPHFDAGLAHEPRLALDGGADGLDACRAILGKAAAHLEPGGRVLLEHGYDQRDALTALAARLGFERVIAADDLAGLPRVAGFRRGSDGRS